MRTTKWLAGWILIMLSTCSTRAEDSSFLTNLPYPQNMEKILHLEPPDMEKLLRQHQRLFRAVADNLRDADARLDRIPLPSSIQGGGESVREITAGLWLGLLSQIDRLRDTNFNFEERASVRAVPPIPYSSGIDPAYVKDPAERRAFVDLTRRNNEKLYREHFEIDMSVLDSMITGHAIRFFGYAYQKTPEDAKALAGLLESVGNPNRKAKMKESLKEILKAASP
jgi:hypothetical protein